MTYRGAIGSQVGKVAENWAAVYLWPIITADFAGFAPPGGGGFVLGGRREIVIVRSNLNRCSTQFQKNVARRFCVFL